MLLLGGYGWVCRFEMRRRVQVQRKQRASPSGTPQEQDRAPQRIRRRWFLQPRFTRALHYIRGHQSCERTDQASEQVHGAGIHRVVDASALEEASGQLVPGTQTSHMKTVRCKMKAEYVMPPMNPSTIPA